MQAERFVQELSCVKGRLGRELDNKVGKVDIQMSKRQYRRKPIRSRGLSLFPRVPLSLPHFFEKNDA